MNILSIVKSISIFLFLNFNLLIAQDAGTSGGLLDDGGGNVWDGGGFDDGGIDGGGTITFGCTDSCADNYNPSVEMHDGSCIYSNCQCLYSSFYIQQYPQIYTCFDAVLNQNMQCEHC